MTLLEECISEGHEWEYQHENHLRQCRRCLVRQVKTWIDVPEGAELQWA